VSSRGAAPDRAALSEQTRRKAGGQRQPSFVVADAPGAAVAASVARLQRLAGNRAVALLLAARTAQPVTVHPVEENDVPTSFASVVARLPIMGPMSPGSSGSAAPPSPGGTARQYVDKHAKDITQALYGHLSKVQLPLNMAHVSWRGEGNAGFMGQFCLQLFMQRDDLWNALVSTTAGVDTSYNLDYLIDRARDLPTLPEQAMQWNNGVVLELANLYLRLLNTSLPRVVPRWVLGWNQRLLAEEKRLAAAGSKDHPDPYKLLPAWDSVRASHPVDRLVVKALWEHLSVDFTAYRKANPAEAVEHTVSATKLRPVDLQILPKALNWARVVTPVGATAEEVANELYGSDAMAYLVIPAAPLFGFATGPDDWPKLKERYRRQIKDNYLGPFHPGTEVPIIGSPESRLSGPQAEEAALNQAAGATPKGDASREAVIERMRLIVGEFAWLQELTKKWNLDTRLEPARLRVDARSKGVAADTGSATAARWAAQTEAQLEVLGMARNAVTVAVNTERQFAAFPATAWIVNHLVWDYVDAAASSDLAATAKQRLAQAEQRSKLFPAEMMEAVLEQLRPAIQTAMIEKTGKSGVSETKGSYAPERYGADVLAAREAKLRHSLARVREVLLADPEKAKAELDRILKELSDLSTSVTFVSNMDNCEAAWQALYENLTTLGNLGPNSTLEADMDAVTEFHGQWRRMYDRWVSAKTPEEKEAVEKELRDKAASPEWTSLFNRIGRNIGDAQTWNKYVTFGVMVGIAIVTGGLGAYVEAFAGAAWGAAAGFGAATVVEAAAFTTLSTALVAKDPTLSGFMDELGKSVLLFGGLKAVGKVYTAVIGEAAAATTVGKLGGMLTQFAALNGVALYEADKAKREKTGGKEGLTEKEIYDISLGNLAFVAAVALGTRLAQPFLANVTLKGQVRGELLQVRNARAAAARLASKLEAAKGKGVSQAEMARLLELNGKALEREGRFLEQLRQRVELAEAGKESGLSAKDLAEIKRALGEHEANKIELLRQQIAMSLQPSAPNSFLCPDGMLPKLIDFYRSVEKATVRELDVDPVTGARSIEVAPKDQAPFRITERVSKPAVDQQPAAGARTRVDKPVKGFYEGVDPKHRVAGWEFRDSKPEADPDYPGFVRVETEITGPAKDGNGKAEGYIERSYNAATKTMLMKNVFIDKLANKVEHPGTTMLGPGKGTPLSTYLTVRQMKILGIDFASLSTVKMTTIQNVPSVIKLARLMKQGMTADEAIVKTESYRYGSTVITQSGLMIAKARVGGDLEPKRLGDMLEHYETRGGSRPVDQAVKDKHDAMLKDKDIGDGQISRDDIVLWNYDVILDVTAIGGGP